MFVHFQKRTARMQVMVNPSAVQIAVGVATILALGGGGSTFLFNIVRTDLKDLRTDLKNMLEDNNKVLKNSQKKVAKKIRQAFEDDDD